MKKIPKEAILLAATALVLVAIIGAFTLKGKANQGEEGQAQAQVQEQAQAPVPQPKKDVADVDPIALPDAKGYEAMLGFVPKQVDHITDKYVLRYVEVPEGKNMVEYYYQTHLATAGERFKISIEKMTPEQYQEYMPADVVREDVKINDIDAVYSRREIYRIPESENLEDFPYETEREKEGYAIIERDELFRELLDYVSIQWYQNGCRYELYLLNQYLDKEEALDCAKYYLDNAK